MKVAPAVRRLMPAAFERMVAAAYRRIFVDLRKVAWQLPVHCPRMRTCSTSPVEMANCLTIYWRHARRACDDGRHRWQRGQVRWVGPPLSRAAAAGISIEAHLGQINAPYDAALPSDVMHHLPGECRAQFLRSVRDALTRGGSILVKDIEPGHPIAWLSLVCDKYVSGDRGVVIAFASGTGGAGRGGAGAAGLGRGDRSASGRCAQLLGAAGSG